MFSPAASSIQHRLFGHVIHTPTPASGLAKPTELDNAEDLDPNTLSGADQVAFYDLKEHEDRYNLLVSTRFDFSSLNFTHNVGPTSTSVGVGTELVIKALPSNNPGTQNFVYRINAMEVLLGYIRATQCAHPALVMQCETLIAALVVEIDDLIQGAMKQWATCIAGETRKHGLRVVHPEDRRDFIYSSPLALSIMVLTAIIHSSMGVSRESCDFILSSLKAILSLAADMQGAQAK